MEDHGLGALPSTTPPWPGARSDPPQRATISGALTTRSAFAHAETVTRLTGALERRGLTVFARIDHAAAAREVGLELADEKVVLFGDPRAGTQLMQTDPRVGIELPLRMLIWDDAEGTLLGYEDPRELAGRYEVASHAPVLEAMSTLLAELAAETAG